MTRTATALFFVGIIAGLYLGTTVGIWMAGLDEPTYRARYSARTDSIIAACVVDTADGVLRLREHWALVRPTGAPVGTAER
jgi:hypothetical protein